MLYSTELANRIETSDTNSKFIEAGIQENVKFVSAKTDKSPNGNRFIAFKFEKDGKELSHTEWETSLRPNETEESCQERGSKQVKRIMQIMQCFYKKEELIFTGSSFEEFTSWVADMMNVINKDTLLRVKIVYNDKGYTTLPSYCKFTFIEPMVLPEGETSKIRIINEIDRLVRPVLADKESVEKNLLDEITSTDDDKMLSDLPF